MKKLIKSFFIILFILFFFYFTRAQEQKSCCILKYTVQNEGLKCYSQGSTVAAPNLEKARECISSLTEDQDCENETNCYCENSSSSWAMFCFYGTITTISHLIFYIISVPAILFFIWGAFLMVSSSGNPEQFSKGKSFIIFTLIGFSIALLSKFLPNILQFFLGM
ncbi:MAG: pilin [Minisyncoccia bacterium]